ncbi:hypothetical protein KJ903_03010 [Patescibacteria group bacterium]|nr:hypothetical protein [Patescibacteria group bacterium]
MSYTYTGIRSKFNTDEFDFTSEGSQTRALEEIKEVAKGGKRGVRRTELIKILQRNMGRDAGRKAYNKITGGKSGGWFGF